MTPEGTAIVTYDWDFGVGEDGFTSTAEPVASFTYSNAGRYSIEVTATNDAGFSESASASFSTSSRVNGMN